MVRSSRRALRLQCACCETFTLAPGVDRRRFLAGGIAALGLGAASPLATPQVMAQSAPAPKTRIDVHHHYIPPFHADALSARRSGGRPPPWTVQMSLDDMDKSGIATAVLSLVQPATWFADDVPLSRRLGRDCNDFGARLVRDHPGRFGLFAVLSPPDVDGSLKEIEYALDTLKADGIGLLTSYGAQYLGDPAFVPIYEELNRRKALVYVHPTTPDCCRGIVPGIPPSSIEYATDSTRAIAHIVFGGTSTRFPDIRWIFSHSGGTLPFLTGRFVRLSEERKPAHLPNGPLPEFRKFYYELAQGNTPGQIAALLKMVQTSQVLYGTDFPFRNGAEVNAGIADYGFDAGTLRAIERETALNLIPRLKAA